MSIYLYNYSDAIENKNYKIIQGIKNKINHINIIKINNNFFN